MNCKLCGHSIMEHGAAGCYSPGDDGNGCKCEASVHSVSKPYLEVINYLQAELARTQAALDAAGEYIKLIEPTAMAYAGVEIFERIEWGYKKERDAYYAALASARGTERG